MKLLSSIIVTTALGRYALAARLLIYTPANEPYAIVTLNTDWTIDRTSKQEFINRDPDTFQHRKIRNGDDNDFAVTGVIDWTTANFTEKRAFWISRADPPWGDDGVMRYCNYCTVQSQQTLKEDVWVFLSIKDWQEEHGDPPWTWSAKDDWLDRNWLQCKGPNGEWNDFHFTKPDDTWY